MRTQTDQEELLDRGGHPTLRELLSHLVFSPANGNIRLNTGRLLLQRVSQTHRLREELIQQCGREEARVIMTRLGFQAGVEDAEFVRTSWPNLDLGDAFTAGTRLHTVSGCVRVETVYNDFDFRKGKFSGEFVWRDSAEAADHLERGVKVMEPACWSQIGYASGYATSYFGKLVVFKELECAAMGHRHCRVAGKPAEMWGDDDEVVRLFRCEVMPKRRVPAQASGSETSRIQEAEQNTANVEAKLAQAILEPVNARLAVIAQAGIPALISGPSNSGKGAAARGLHEMTMGRRAPIEYVSCRDLVAADMDALIPLGTWKREKARGPSPKTRTVVLQHIEELPDPAQAKLASFLDEGARALAGSSRLRLIATSRLTPQRLASHPGLRGAVYYRFAILPITMPSLRDRQADLLYIAKLFLIRAAVRYGQTTPDLSQDAERELATRDFQGNYLELEALLTGAMLCARNGSLITAQDLRESGETVRLEAPTSGRSDPMEAWLETAFASGELKIEGVMARIYDEALRHSRGNVSAAARLLGLSRAQLAYRLGQT